MDFSEAEIRQIRNGHKTHITNSKNDEWILSSKENLLKLIESSKSDKSTKFEIKED